MSDFLPHDPDAGPIDYSIDFTDWLSAGDSVSDVNWSIVPAGPTLSNPSIVGAVATTFLSGGVVGNKHRLTARVTSANSLVDDRTILLQVGEL